MAIIGVLSMLAGVALITWGARRLGKSPDPRADSLLAPTLAIDTLDPDLRVLYTKTLVLDAKCEAHYGSERRADWSAMGRELRRALIAEQSRRVRELGAEATERIERVLDDALRRVDRDAPLDAAWDELCDAARADRLVERSTKEPPTRIPFE